MKASKASAPKHTVTVAAVVATVQPTRWTAWILAALGASIVLWIVYAPALGGPFLLDDTYLPYAQPAMQQAPLSAWLQGVRPMLMLTYWLNYQASGENTGSYHFVNLLLHLLNGGLIYLIVRKILEWSKSRNIELLAAFAAGLFLWHPLQTESVSYIASRSETQSVFFFLAASAVFMYRGRAAASWAIAAAVFLLFGAAFLTKEHAAVFPFMLLLTDYYWNPGFSLEGIKRNWRIYAPMLLGLVAALAFTWRVLSNATSAGFALQDLPWHQYFFTECRAIWRYLLFYVLPFGQNLDHEYQTSQTILDHGAIFGLLGLIALAGAAWFYRKRFPVVSFGVFTLLLLFAPTSSIVPIRDTLVERRMYLPFLGLALVTVGLLRRWNARRSTITVALASVLFAAAALSYARNQLWSSATAIWADSAAKSPTKVRPHFQLAYAYYVEGQCAQAVNEFAYTARLEKPGWDLYVDWGLASDCAGHPDDALAKLRQAAELNKTGYIYSQIGMVYAKMGRYPQALDALDTAATLDPNFGRTYVYRGNIYALQGNKPRAIEEFQKALQIDPRDEYARDGLMKVAQR